MHGYCSFAKPQRIFAHFYQDWWVFFKLTCVKFSTFYILHIFTHIFTTIDVIALSIGTLYHSLQLLIIRDRMILFDLFSIITQFVSIFTSIWWNTNFFLHFIIKNQSFFFFLRNPDLKANQNQSCNIKVVSIDSLLVLIYLIVK